MPASARARCTTSRCSGADRAHARGGLVDARGDDDAPGTRCRGRRRKIALRACPQGESVLDLEEAALVGLREAARHGGGAAADRDLHEVGAVGLPLRTTGVRARTGHLELGHCHGTLLDGPEDERALASARAATRTRCGGTAAIGALGCTKGRATTTHLATSRRLPLARSP